MTHTEPRSSVSSLPEHCRNRPPRSWFVIRHRCHFVKQRLCLATQTTIELARSERTASAKAPRRPISNAAFACRARHGWSGAARHRTTRHYVSCNDSLGRRRVGLNDPRRRPGSCRRIGNHAESYPPSINAKFDSEAIGQTKRNFLPLVESSFSSVEVFEDCSGGNSRLSYLLGCGGRSFLY